MCPLLPPGSPELRRQVTESSGRTARFVYFSSSANTAVGAIDGAGGKVLVSCQQSIERQLFNQEQTSFP